MLTNMKHRTFLPILKNPFIFSTFPTEKPTFSEPETYGSALRNLCFPHGKHKNLSNKSNFIPRDLTLCFIASRKIRFVRLKKE